MEFTDNAEHNDVQLLRSQLDTLKSKVKYLTPMSIVVDSGAQIPVPEGYTQPPNGTVYTLGHGVEAVVTLPDTSNFQNQGFTITIFNNEGSGIILQLNSFDMNDVVIYNKNSYFTPGTDSFVLDNKGYVNMTWTIGGWVVTSSYGFTLSA